MLNLSAFLSSQGHHLCRWPCKPTNGVGKLGVVAANVDPTDTRPTFTYWYAQVTRDSVGKVTMRVSTLVLLTSLHKKKKKMYFHMQK